jgi:hypothetical protein
MNQLLKELKYSLYLTVHPYKGFWEIKHEKQGSLKTAVILALSYLIVSVLSGFYSGYLFNADGGVNFNIYKSIATSVLLFFLWCIANWCLTSLYDGEGSFQDIFKATAYALTPMILINLILIPLSKVFSLQEASFYSMLLYMGILWSAFLLFSGTLVTHQYTFGKTILIIVCILLGMCMIVYIMLLFFNLIQQISGFVVTLWAEFNLRIS